MKIWRNRAILSIIMVVIAVAIFAIQYYDVYDIGAIVWPAKQDDPVAPLEKSGVVDVIYFGVGEYESNLLGKTPVFVLGVIYYPPGLKGVDDKYHVRLTARGWNIIQGRYDWKPSTKMKLELADAEIRAAEAALRGFGVDPEGMAKEYKLSTEELALRLRNLLADAEEKRVEIERQPFVEESSLDDKIHKWNFEKLYYYRENALFKPGESERVTEAMLDLLDYVEEREFREWLYAVFVIAEQQEIGWRVIEIDFVKPVGFTDPEAPMMLFGYTEETEATYVMGMWPELQGSYQIFRARMEDGVKHYIIKEIVGAGELTSEAWSDLLETGHVQVVPSDIGFGPRRYAKGFNHPWMGRELEGKT